MQKEDWVVCLDDTASHDALRRGRLYRVANRRTSGVVVEDWRGERADWNGSGTGSGTRWIEARFAVVRKAGEIEEGDLVEYLWCPAIWFYGTESEKKRVKRLIFPDSIELRKLVRGILGDSGWMSPDNPHEIKDRVEARAVEEEDAEEKAIVEEINPAAVRAVVENFSEAEANAAMIARDGPPEPKAVEPYDWEGAAALGRAVEITALGAVHGGWPYDPNGDCTEFVPGSRGKEDDDGRAGG